LGEGLTDAALGLSVEPTAAQADEARLEVEDEILDLAMVAEEVERSVSPMAEGTVEEPAQDKVSESTLAAALAAKIVENSLESTQEIINLALMANTEKAPDSPLAEAQADKAAQVPEERLPLVAKTAKEVKSSAKSAETVVGTNKTGKKLKNPFNLFTLANILKPAKPETTSEAIDKPVPVADDAKAQEITVEPKDEIVGLLPLANTEEAPESQAAPAEKSQPVEAEAPLVLAEASTIKAEANPPVSRVDLSAFAKSLKVKVDTDFVAFYGTAGLSVSSMSATYITLSDVLPEASGVSLSPKVAEGPTVMGYLAKSENQTVAEAGGSVKVETEAEMGNGTIEPDAVVRKGTVESEAVEPGGTVEPDAVVPKGTVESEGVVAGGTVEPEAVADVVVPESEAVAAMARPEPEDPKDTSDSVAVKDDEGESSEYSIKETILKRMAEKYKDFDPSLFGVSYEKAQPTEIADGDETVAVDNGEAATDKEPETQAVVEEEKPEVKYVDDSLDQSLVNGLAIAAMGEISLEDEAKDFVGTPVAVGTEALGTDTPAETVGEPGLVMEVATEAIDEPGLVMEDTTDAVGESGLVMEDTADDVGESGLVMEVATEAIGESGLLMEDATGAIGDPGLGQEFLAEAVEEDRLGLEDTVDDGGAGLGQQYVAESEEEPVLLLETVAEEEDEPVEYVMEAVARAVGEPSAAEPWEEEPLVLMDMVEDEDEEVEAGLGSGELAAEAGGVDDGVIYGEADYFEGEEYDEYDEDEYDEEDMEEPVQFELEPWPEGFLGSDDQQVEHLLATMENRLFKKQLSRSYLVPKGASEVNWEALKRIRLRGL
jgi:hypothetical protein